MSDTLHNTDDDSLKKTFEKFAGKAVKSLAPVRKLLERVPVVGNALKGLNLGNEIVEF